MKFREMKDGGPNFRVETNWQNVSIIWSPLLYFNLKSSIDLYNSSFIRFHSFLHESWVFLSESWNFWKVKKGDRISGGNQFCRMSELFGPPFCVPILKALLTQILRHSLDSSYFCMNMEYFSKSSKISTN